MARRGGCQTIVPASESSHALPDIDIYTPIVIGVLEISRVYLVNPALVNPLQPLSRVVRRGDNLLPLLASVWVCTWFRRDPWSAAATPPRPAGNVMGSFREPHNSVTSSLRLVASE